MTSEKIDEETVRWVVSHSLISFSGISNLEQEMSKSEVKERTPQPHLERKAMGIITLQLDDSERLDVSSVVAGLQAEFAGTTITEDDSFEAERRRATASMAELAKGSSPIKNPQRIIQRITNKEKAMGPGVDIRVPVGASLWQGHVWTRSIMLTSDAAPSDEDVNSLKTFLSSLGVGRIMVVDC